MSQSTITVQQVVNYASQHTELMPLISVGGYTNEPALSIANDVLSELLGQPFPWKFNRKAAPVLVTQQWKQDYKFAGASAFTQNGGAAIGLASANAITESSFTVTVNTIEPHNFNVGDTVFMTGNTVAAYNSTFSSTPSGSAWTGGWTITATPTTTSFRFTHATSGLANSGAPGITDLGWLESATMVNMNDTSAAQYVWFLQAVRMLEPSNRQFLPDRVASIADDGAGTLTIRLQYLPGPQPLGVSLIYQQRPTLITTLSSTWAPFPDEFAYVYRQLFLAHAYRFANSGRADVEYQKAMAGIAKALGTNDREQSDEYITPEGSLGGTSSWAGWWF
jgi:hypothetical protein